MKTGRHNFSPREAKSNRGQALHGDAGSARWQRRRAAALKRTAAKKSNSLSPALGQSAARLGPVGERRP